MLLLFWQSGSPPSGPPTHTGKSASFGLTFTGLTPATSLVFVGKGVGHPGFTDVLAVDTGDTLAVDGTFDLQVDTSPGDALVFVGKTSAETI